MDDHAGRFVDHGEMLVLKYDIERDIFGLETDRRQLGKFNVDLVALTDLIGGFDRLAVDENVFVLDQAREARPRPAIDVFGEESVETCARRRLAGPESEPVGLGCVT